MSLLVASFTHQLFKPGSYELPAEVPEPNGGLDIVADDNLPRMSNYLDLSSGQNVSEGGIATVCPACGRRTTAHLTHSYSLAAVLTIYYSRHETDPVLSVT